MFYFWSQRSYLTFEHNNNFDLSILFFNILRKHTQKRGLISSWFPTVVTGSNIYLKKKKKNFLFSCGRPTCYIPVVRVIFQYSFIFLLYVFSTKEVPKYKSMKMKGALMS